MDRKFVWHHVGVDRVAEESRLHRRRTGHSSLCLGTFRVNRNDGTNERHYQARRRRRCRAGSPHNSRAFQSPRPSSPTKRLVQAHSPPLTLPKLSRSEGAPEEEKGASSSWRGEISRFADRDLIKKWHAGRFDSQEEGLFICSPRQYICLRLVLLYEDLASGVPNYVASYVVLAS